MKLFFQLCSLIHTFNLAAILRSIAFPFVLLYVCYFYAVDELSTFTTKLDLVELPKAQIAPLQDLYNQLETLTVKNLREITGIKKRLTKTALIEAYLVTL
jgi:hypothetical protein